MSIDFVRVQQAMHYWQRRFGWAMLAGLLLMGCALLFYVAVGLSADRRLKYMNTHVVQMRAAIAQRQKNWVAESPQAAVQTFYRMLQPERTAPDYLEKIFDAAYESNLGVDAGEFAFAHDKGSSFARFQVSLPVSGSYVNIRTFVNRVLREMPSAALEEIGFSREDVRNPEVQAKVRFTLYLGAKR